MTNSRSDDELDDAIRHVIALEQWRQSSPLRDLLDDRVSARTWDIFLSYASEDKESVAKPLANALKKAGVRVWIDEHKLTIGDSLGEKIDEGLFRVETAITEPSPPQIRT
jgi:hypothetical protein